MIIISPKSGHLGNQLFNIFAGIQYALKFKVPFRIVWNSKIKNDHTDDLFKNLVSFKRNNWAEVTHEYPGNHPAGPHFVAVYRELRYVFNPLQESHPKHNFALTGYYHSYKYFYMKYRDILRLMKFDEIKQEVLERHSNIDTHQDICLTFHSSIHKEKYISGKDFYVRCLKDILDDINSGKFVEKRVKAAEKERDSKRRMERLRQLSALEQDEEGMITIPKEKEKDNSEIVLENVDKKEVYRILCCGYKDSYEEMLDTICHIKNSDLGANFEFTVIDNDVPDWEKMLLTSNSKFNVLSTNMLSWWSAYFCEVKDKEVYYPSKWYNVELNTKDLFPMEWTKVNVSEEFENVKDSVTLELTDDHTNEEPGIKSDMNDVDENLKLSIEEN